MRSETSFTSRLKEQNAIRSDVSNLSVRYKARLLSYFDLCEHTNLSSTSLCLKHLWAQRAKKAAKSVVKKQTCFELDKNDEGAASVS
jgi:hypothetical protein